jgi:GMP synthase (glutamine-hydrolysing)
VEFVSALDDTIDWNFPEVVMQQYAGVILGGSGDFDFDGGRSNEDPAKVMSYELLGKLRPLFTYLFEHDIPTLGICYGHQLLGAFAGAQVKHFPEQSKTRSHTVRLLVNRNDHFLFTDLPTSFSAFYGHKDSLDRVPEGATLIMEGGETCKISALRFKENIYTTQFHPELTYEDMLERIRNSPGYLPEGVTIESLYQPDNSTNTILQNFGTFIAQRQEQTVSRR